MNLTSNYVSFLFFFKVFIYFWLHWFFVAAHRLSLVAGSRGYSSLRCTGVSLPWLLLLPSTGSRHTGFSSCGAGIGCPEACGIFPWPGIKLSPALVDGALTTEPLGKPCFFHFNPCFLLFLLQGKTIYYKVKKFPTKGMSPIAENTHNDLSPTLFPNA